MILICAVMGSGEDRYFNIWYKVMPNISVRRKYLKNVKCEGTILVVWMLTLCFLFPLRAAPQRSPEPGVHWRRVQAARSRKQDGLSPSLADGAAANGPELNDCVTHPHNPHHTPLPHTRRLPDHHPLTPPWLLLACAPSSSRAKVPCRLLPASRPVPPPLLGLRVKLLLVLPMFELYKWVSFAKVASTNLCQSILSFYHASAV